jgi:hypothetical protein
VYTQRVLKVTLGFAEGVTITYDERFAIRMTCDKHILSSYNRASIEIMNLNKNRRSEMLTEFNQFLERKLKTPFVSVLVQMGRRGDNQLKQVYKGFILNCTMSTSPDILLSLQCGTDLVDRATFPTGMPPMPIRYKALCEWCAGKMGKVLDINDLSIDSVITNFYPQSSVAALPVMLQRLYPDKVAAFIDDDFLIVKDIYAVAASPPPIEVNRDTGLIGTPTWNPFGITGTVLADLPIRLGKGVSVTSTVNTTINGAPMVVTKISYELTSRDNPWYLHFSASPAATK